MIIDLKNLYKLLHIREDIKRIVHGLMGISYNQILRKVDTLEIRTIDTISIPSTEHAHTVKLLSNLAFKAHLAVVQFIL